VVASCLLRLDIWKSRLRILVRLTILIEVIRILLSVLQENAIICILKHPVTDLFPFRIQSHFPIRVNRPITYAVKKTIVKKTIREIGHTESRLSDLYNL
jgi:hypothetical protein